jgi:hypothetical protein
LLKTGIEFDEQVLFTLEENDGDFGAAVCRQTIQNISQKITVINGKSVFPANPLFMGFSSKKYFLIT